VKIVDQMLELRPCTIKFGVSKTKSHFVLIALSIITITHCLIFTMLFCYNAGFNGSIVEKVVMKSAAALAGVDSETVLARDWSCVERGGPHVLVYRVPCRLQESVTCGPVCLMMAADALDQHHGKSCDGLVKLAIERRFSRKGEMFSCSALALLAEEYFGFCATVVDEWDESLLARRLEQDSVLALVPYDCANNFEPALHDGERAHWAVVAGFERNDQDRETIDRFFCVQPKSKRVGIWSARDLVLSNRNLKSCRNKQQQDLLVPDDLEELRGKMVILMKQN
jgi:hypothetical protein